jgi:tetratricopeptide (TPR) repeat protein
VSGDQLTEPSETTQAEVLIKESRRALSEGNIQLATKSLEQRDKLFGINAESQHMQGMIQFRLHKIDDAIQLVEKAIAQDPNNARFLHSYATFISTAGRFIEAQRVLVKLIAEDPTHTSAFSTLAGIRKFKPGDDVLWTMERNVVGRPLSTSKAANLCFGLAKAYDDLGEYDKAWQAVTQGNNLVEMDDPTAFFNKGVERSKAVYTKDFIQQRSQMGHKSRAPVFVVGMPRSGTTLTEKVLAEHMDVSATGELSALGQIGAMMAKDVGTQSFAGHADTMAKAVPQQVYGAARGYLEYAQQHINGWSERFVDKMPDNSFNLGLAACLFPNAHIVHVMRHPLDIMLSIYFKKFGQIRYGFDVGWIVAHYQAYRDAMSHWRQVLPDGQLIEIRYENLVEDKNRARDILLGRIISPAEHYPAIASERQTVSKVMTASRWQVRQPVYKTSKGKWRNYETKIQPFIDAFGGLDAIEADVIAQDARCALRVTADGHLSPYRSS